HLQVASFNLVPSNLLVAAKWWQLDLLTGRRINPYRLHISLKTFKEKDNDLSIWERELIFVTFCEACHERPL
ncbi:hypothetical protein, partial [Pseudomonas sp. GTC 16473]|uniref:hypothetical protein n=1 Tax=Pseudomonas sp. GTC 16473 TaxID=1661060 RepID=UPI001C47861C